MKNQPILRFEAYLAKAILEIKRLEGRLLEERMKCQAYEIELNKKNNPVPGKQKANEKRLKELFKAMKI